MAFFSRKKKGSKAEADDFFTKGQWANALGAYEKALGKNSRDVKLIRRVADLRAKIGRTEAAVEAYRQAAEIYAESGFLVQSIAIYKILLRLDPSAEDVGKKLTSLYSERGITQGGKAPAAVEPSAAAEDAAAVEEPQRLKPDELPSIPLFSDLPAEAFMQVLEKLVPHNLEGGEYLFREGDPGDSIFVIASGGVEIVIGDNVLATLGEGLFFGEGAFFSREPRNADVRAGLDQSTELLEIRREDLEELMGQHAGVMDALNRFYRTRIVDRMMGSSVLLEGLEAQARTEIQELFETLEVTAGQEIICEDDDDTDFYFIIRGRFGVYTTSPLGEVVELAELGAGEFFGEVALLSGTSRTATVKALDSGELLKVDGLVFYGYLEKYPSVRQVLENIRDQRASDTVAKVLATL
jgi:CRP-like cAMP-binding protein